MNMDSMHDSMPKSSSGSSDPSELRTLNISRILSFAQKDRLWPQDVYGGCFLIESANDAFRYPQFR